MAPKIYRQRTIAYRPLCLGQVPINLQPGTSRNALSITLEASTGASSHHVEPRAQAQGTVRDSCIRQDPPGSCLVMVPLAWCRMGLSSMAQDTRRAFPQSGSCQGLTGSIWTANSQWIEVLRGGLSSGVPWGFCVSLWWLKGLQVILWDSEHSANQTQLLKEFEDYKRSQVTVPSRPFPHLPRPELLPWKEVRGKPGP